MFGTAIAHGSRRLQSCAFGQAMESNEGDSMSVKIKDVFMIADRGENDKSPWSKIGVAFVNKDESLNVKLDAIPVTGKIHIRDRKPVANNTMKRKPYEETHNHHHDTVDVDRQHV